MEVDSRFRLFISRGQIRINPDRLVVFIALVIYNLKVKETRIDIDWEGKKLNNEGIVVGIDSRGEKYRSQV